MDPCASTVPHGDQLKGAHCRIENSSQTLSPFPAKGKPQGKQHAPKITNSVLGQSKWPGLNSEPCAENTLPQPRNKQLKGLPAGSQVPVITIDHIPYPATTWQLSKESSSSHSPGKPARRESSSAKSRNLFLRESYNPPGFRPSALGAPPCKTSCLMTSPCKQSCGSRKNQRCFSPGPGLRAGSFHHRELLGQQKTEANPLRSLPSSGHLRKARLMSLNPVRAKAPDPAFGGLVVAERLWTRPAALPGKPISPHTLYPTGILHYTSLCSMGEEEDEGCEPQEPRDGRVRKHHLDSNLIS
ncbi:unnamed protein product [Lepidochelys olivacea]